MQLRYVIGYVCIGMLGCVARGAADQDRGTVSAGPANGTYFTPATRPTAMYFKPPAERALLQTPINAKLSVIATSEYHEFFIIDGKLFAIGGNRSGMMGLGNADPSPHVKLQRVAVPDGTTFVTAAAGGYQSLAVDSAGYVWSFGNNVFGQRGDGSIPKPETLTSSKAEDGWGIPIKLTSDAAGKPFGGPADPVVQVVSVLWFNLARTASGGVYMWGMNGNDHGGSDSRGIIGDGQPIRDDKTTGEDVEARAVRRPTRVIFPQGTVISYIAASSSMAIAIDKDGHLWTWGGGSFGLGVGDPGEKNANRSAPVMLKQGRPREGAPLGSLPLFVDVTTNTGTNFAIDQNGDLWGWGMLAPALGFVAPAEWNPQGYPVKLTRTGNPHYAGLDALLKAGRRPKSIQASKNSTHILFDDGSLWGWGGAAMGEVGDGHIVNYLTVTRRADGKNIVRCAWDWGGTKCLVQDATRIMTHVRSFSTSEFSFHVMAVREDGTIYSWGRNANGVLGNGLTPSDWESPALKQFAPLGEVSAPNIYDVPFPVLVQPF